MYAFIEGQVCEKGANEIVLLAGGVGYRIAVSMTTLQSVPAVGETMRCYTILSVRDDAMELFICVELSVLIRVAKYQNVLLPVG